MTMTEYDPGYDPENPHIPSWDDLYPNGARMF